VRLTIEKLGGKENLSNQDRCDVSASFQKAVKLHLIQKSKKIFKNSQTKNFAIVGGASANLYIRKAYQSLCDEFDKNLILAPLEYCSDNSAMIGRYAIESYNKKEFISTDDIDIVVTKKLSSGDLLV
jgi:N6-L-threonylcarbamoyladenine synthase